MEEQHTLYASVKIDGVPTDRERLSLSLAGNLVSYFQMLKEQLELEDTQQIQYVTAHQMQDAEDNHALVTPEAIKEASRVTVYVRSGGGRCFAQVPPCLGKPLRYVCVVLRVFWDSPPPSV
jgi:hypothetical protein